MDILEAIVSAVQTIGVPAVTLLGCMWYINQTDIRQRTERDTLTSAHKAESDKWIEAVTNNTLAMQKLCTLIEQEGLK